QSCGGWLRVWSVFPLFLFPTEYGFGYDRTNLFLPVWAEKDFGPWSVFGGGGWQLNPGAGERNFWQSGLVVTRSFGDRFSLGVEAFHQTAQDFASKPFTGVNVGATYRLTKHWTL